MRRWTSLALPAVLLLAVSAAGSLAQTGGGDKPAPAEKQSQPGPLGWLNPFHRSGKDQPKAAPAEAADAVKKKAGPTVVEAATERRENEAKILFRRLEVCDKLKEIADQTRDETLMRLALQLEQRINEIYNRHTGAPAGSEEGNAAPGGPDHPRPGSAVDPTSGGTHVSGQHSARKEQP